MKCHRCQKGYHMKCVGGTRRAVELRRDRQTWTCDQCEEVQREVPSGPEAREIAAAGWKKRGGEGIRVLQWNYDYLATKVDELESQVERERMYVLMIQETKLGVTDRTPSLPGFTTVRKDRKGTGAYMSRRGSLIMYIRSDLSFWHQNIGNLRGSVEAQAIRVPMTRTRSLVLVNLHVPLRRDGERIQLQEMEEVPAPWTRCALGLGSQRAPPTMGPSSGGGREGRDPKRFDGRHVPAPASTEQWRPHEI